MKTTLTKKYRCPACNTTLNAATSLDNPKAIPKTDDLSVCIECGVWMVFNKDLTCRVAQEEDLADVDKKTLNILWKTQSIIEGNKNVSLSQVSGVPRQTKTLIKKM